jgi:peptide deformylase
VLRIVPYPHPALRFESKPVTRIDDDFRAVVRQMFDAMYAAKGIGLAANQVGIPLRFFILNLSADPAQPDQEQVFVNPEIVKRHSAVEDEEGCLSFPGIYAKVRRARKVRVRAYDLNGKAVEIDADDLLARAIQHETDHLAGKLFIDLLDEADRVATAAKIREVEAGFRRAQLDGIFPADAAIEGQLTAMAKASATRPT